MSPWIGVGICAAALAVAAINHRRPAVRTAALAVALAGFFAAWAVALPAPWRGTSTLRACLLLGSAIAMFRLMAGFEKGRG